MKVKKIIQETWQGNKLQNIETECLDIAQAESALTCLDGKVKTMVIYWVNDNAVMTVGGGSEKFVVSIAFEIDTEIFTLVSDKDQITNLETLVVGGQAGCYPANQCVSRQLATEAASYFCTYGKPSPNLTWLHEC